MVFDFENGQNLSFLCVPLLIDGSHLLIFLKIQMLSVVFVEMNDTTRNILSLNFFQQLFLQLLLFDFRDGRISSLISPIYEWL